MEDDRKERTDEEKKNVGNERERKIKKGMKKRF